MKTILITGASSGIGQATTAYFLDQGWNVIATMRNPDAAGDIKEHPNAMVVALDVTDHASISSAVAAGEDRFGAIDVLLNNAGYGAYGPLEAFSMDRIERVFDTNVIGVMATMKAVIPGMRRAGLERLLMSHPWAGNSPFRLAHFTTAQNSRRRIVRSSFLRIGCHRHSYADHSAGVCENELWRCGI